MAEISVNSNRVMNAADDFKAARNRINGFVERLNAVSNQLDPELRSAMGISSSLSLQINQMRELAKKTESMAAFLVSAAAELVALENQVKILVGEDEKKVAPTWVKAVPVAMAAKASTGTTGEAMKNVFKPEPGIATQVLDKTKELVGKAVTKADQKFQELKASAPEKIQNAGVQAGAAGAAWLIGKGLTKAADALGIEGVKASAGAAHSSSALSSVGTYGGDTWAAQTSASLGNVNAGAKASAAFDPAGGNIGVNASADVRVTGAEVKASVVGAAGMAAASAALGVAEAGVSASTKLMQEGSFVPSVSASAYGKVAAIEASAMARAGNNAINATATATGNVGAIKGSAKAVFDPANLNVGAEVGGMVAAAEGNAKVGADLGLIKADVNVKGYAGAVGASASAAYKDGTLKVGLDLALGVGGGVEFDVGLGSVVKNLDKVTKGAVGDAVAAVSSGVQAAGAAVGTVVEVGKSIGKGVMDVGSSIAKGDVMGVATGIGNIAKNVVSNVGSGVQKVASAVGNAISSAAKSVWKVFKFW